jgi:hypothetical protein
MPVLVFHFDHNLDIYGHVNPGLKPNMIQVISTSERQAQEWNKDCPVTKLTSVKLCKQLRLCIEHELNIFGASIYVVSFNLFKEKK